MSIIYRRGTLDDSQNTFEVFHRSIMDLGDRLGVMPISGGNNPQVIQICERSGNRCSNTWRAHRTISGLLKKTTKSSALRARSCAAVCDN